MKAERKSLEERAKLLARKVRELMKELPTATRIEVDVEYLDGSRMKIEVKA